MFLTAYNLFLNKTQCEIVVTKIRINRSKATTKSNIWLTVIQCASNPGLWKSFTRSRSELFESQIVCGREAFERILLRGLVEMFTLSLKFVVFLFYAYILGRAVFPAVHLFLFRVLQNQDAKHFSYWTPSAIKIDIRPNREFKASVVYKHVAHAGNRDVPSSVTGGVKECHNNGSLLCSRTRSCVQYAWSMFPDLCTSHAIQLSAWHHSSWEICGDVFYIGPAVSCSIVFCGFLTNCARAFV